MHRAYDDLIAEHYRETARHHGLAPTSSMLDETTRAKETDAVLQYVDAALKKLHERSGCDQAVILDVGCGNGFTLEVLARTFPGERYVGVENSPELRTLATARFASSENVMIESGDIRDQAFTSTIADVLVCQRVLINLLSLEDQRLALENLISCVVPAEPADAGGTLIFIESFAGPLKRLNEARDEFQLPPIPPAEHNLYLPDEFFDNHRLCRFSSEIPLPPPNFLSTHYFVTRVLHPIFTGKQAFKRNSEFVRFFSTALHQNVGDYAPLKLHAFRRAALC